MIGAAVCVCVCVPVWGRVIGRDVLISSFGDDASVITMIQYIRCRYGLLPWLCVDWLLLPWLPMSVEYHGDTFLSSLFDVYRFIMEKKSVG